ncbi:cell wall-binding repeat-containing protein [Euzebya pacifica]|nr:cell wall-binding repeat-containing protein [Euzebya pacifica]
MVMLIAMVGTPSAIASPQQSPTPSTTREMRNPGPSAAPWFDNDLATVQRIDAGDPIATAIAVSRERFADDEAEVVVVSRDDVFADSLAATVFATRGPILLTDSATLDGRVAAEITRVLQPDGIVYLMGGQAALSSTIEQQLADSGHQVRRMAGASRVETAVAVAREWREHYEHAGWFTFARSDQWADSITASLWVAGRAPVLLTPSDTPHPAVEAFLGEEGGGRRFEVAGGEAAVAEHVVQAYLAASAWTGDKYVFRMAGPTRVATAAAVDVHYNGRWSNDVPGPSHHIVINGFADDGWVYGLPAATLTTGQIQDANVSLMLVDTNRIDAPAAARLSPCYDTYRHVLIVGPTSHVNTRVADAMADTCQPDVLAPDAGETWWCDTLPDDFPNRLFTVEDDLPDWRHPIDWFNDDQGVDTACYDPKTSTSIARGRGSAFRAWADTRLPHDVNGIEEINMVRNGLSVSGFGLPYGPEGRYSSVHAVFANADGVSLYLEVIGPGTPEDWTTISLDEVVDAAAEILGS